MFIVMHCMGMPFNGATIKTGSLGGSETAAYYVAKELAAQGHAVTLFTTHPEGGIWDGVRYLYCGEQTAELPLGHDFHFYAMQTPHDVLIIQRHPQAFMAQWASKVNLWWLHDLALIRHRNPVSQMMWNIDGILTVSEYHRQQIIDIYDVEPHIVHDITNGIDLEVFKGDFDGTFDEDDVQRFRMVYSSRPERGLEHLVRPGGIMEKLGEEYQLYACAYDNVTPQMKAYYEYLWQRCAELPNVTNIGSLTKKHLADLMRQCQLLIYPTEFEEVSCITAMEAMAAGLPMLTSDHAALPETCGEGTRLIPLKDGYADEKEFIKQARKLRGSEVLLPKMRKKQLARAKEFTWARTAASINEIVEHVFAEYSPESQFNALIHNSDYYAAKLIDLDYANQLTSHKDAIVRRCYEFAETGKFREHYEAYYEYEKEKGNEPGPEDVTGTTRYCAVADRVALLSPGSVVLDYGCAHGHYTVSLAKQFPALKFIGFDIAESNIKIAKDWANLDGVKNIEFIVCDVLAQDWMPPEPASISLVIAAEVMEHVDDPALLADRLQIYLVENGEMVITTPYGPWEAQGYAKEFPWRAHLHHFEREDLKDMWGHFDQYNIIACPAGKADDGQQVGSYVTTFKCDGTKWTKAINYDRKLATTAGRETISLCMIARDAAHSIGAAISSVLPAVDEVVVAVDEKTMDKTLEVISDLRVKNPMVLFNYFLIESPLETGFDVARNASIDAAHGDWILWMDCDERFIHPHAIRKFIRHSQHDGFAIPQVHFSGEPLGVLKTDLPTRLFRRGCARFFGVVHEHPERKMNEGIGKIIVMPEVQIIHHGYDTEDTRRARFRRNYGLMKRDRKENPDRKLGKALWIRDTAMLLQWKDEVSAPWTLEDKEQARSAIDLWVELVDLDLRMATEVLGYQNYLASKLMDEKAINYEFALRVTSPRLNPPTKDPGDVYSGTFIDPKHAQKYFRKIEAGGLKDINSRYL